MNAERTVLLFVKLPEPGKVKSRLARDIGGERALRLYECMVRDTLDMLHGAKIPFRIVFDPPQASEAMRKWLGKSHSFQPQTGDDLGERMESAFQAVFDEGAREAVLIGSDIPGLTASLVSEAFGAFGRHDAVIGPANDGGYYLIGFRNSSFTRSIFHAMPWSTGSVFQETLERLRNSARKVFVLPECIDVDTRDDLRTLLSRQSAAGSSRTIDYIMRHHGDMGL